MMCKVVNFLWDGVNTTFTFRVNNKTSKLSKCGWEHIQIIYLRAYFVYSGVIYL